MEAFWTKEPTQEGKYFVYAVKDNNYGVLKIIKVNEEFCWIHPSQELAQPVGAQPLHLLKNVYWYGPIPNPPEEL